MSSVDGGVQVLAGSTFGGGSSVNWCCSLRTPVAVREEWAKDFGVSHVLSRKPINQFLLKTLLHSPVLFYICIQRSFVMEWRLCAIASTFTAISWVMKPSITTPKTRCFSTRANGWASLAALRPKTLWATTNVHTAGSDASKRFHFVSSSSPNPRPFHPTLIALGMERSKGAWSRGL